MPGFIPAGLGWVFGVNTLQFHSFDTTGRKTFYIESERTHTHTLTDTHCCCCFYLLLSQNLMTLFWLLCLWVSIISPKRVSFCSCPSISIRPRKNQWRLCSLGHRGTEERSQNEKHSNKNYRAEQHAQHTAALLMCLLQ